MPIDLERTIMKIGGVLVDTIVEIIPETWKNYLAHDGNISNLLCVRMLKLSSGIMKVDIIHYKQFVKDINKIGHALNPC